MVGGLGGLLAAGRAGRDSRHARPVWRQPEHLAVSWLPPYKAGPGSAGSPSGQARGGGRAEARRPALLPAAGAAGGTRANGPHPSAPAWPARGMGMDGEETT